MSLHVAFAKAAEAGLVDGAVLKAFGNVRKDRVEIARIDAGRHGLNRMADPLAVALEKMVAQI